MTVSRPLLRYHGGKWRLAPWILRHLPRHRVYVEPFGGAASVLLQKPRSYAEVYNDLDGEVVSLFRVVRERGAELLEALELTPFSRDEFVGSYEPTGDPLEQARRTLVRSFMGFGSDSHGKRTAFRANSNRSGTSPAQDWRNYPVAFAAVVDRLRGVIIENRDALDVMRQHAGERTLHYVDPPYVRSTRGIRGGNYRHEYTDDEHAALLEFLGTLRGAVVLSGYRCELYDAALSGWRRIDRNAHADGARPRVESLWLSPTTAVAPDLFADAPRGIDDGGCAA